MNLLDQHLQDHAAAMMLITHDLALAASWLTHLTVMDEGRIVEQVATAMLRLSCKSRAPL